MELKKMRKRIEEIYAQYCLKVDEWKEGTECLVSSTFQRSFFAFDESLGLANDKIRAELGEEVFE